MVAAIKSVTLKGRDWLVVPMVMLTEGTHAGSNGPIFYPRDELAKSAALWEGTPIVVNHPLVNGVSVSITDKRVKPHIIGLVRRPGMDRTGRRLQAEAWLDMTKTPERITRALLANRVLEISTGVFTDNETVGREVWGRNYRPDHLAILPDQVGACSIQKGCGLAVAV